MFTPRLSLILVMLLLPGCALWKERVAVSASCPPSPQAPQAVTDYAYPERSLIEDSGQLLNDFTKDLSQTLRKASGEPM